MPGGLVVDRLRSCYRCTWDFPGKPGILGQYYFVPEDTPSFQEHFLTSANWRDLTKEPCPEFGEVCDCEQLWRDGTPPNYDFPLVYGCAAPTYAPEWWNTDGPFPVDNPDPGTYAQWLMGSDAIVQNPGGGSCIWTGTAAQIDFVVYNWRLRLTGSPLNWNFFLSNGTNPAAGIVNYKGRTPWAQYGKNVMDLDYDLTGAFPATIELLPSLPP